MRIATEPVRAELLAVDESFFAALLEGDRERLEGILGPDFVIVDVAAGGVTGREAFLAAVASGVVSFVAIDRFPDEALVRTYGEVGVVVGRTRMTFSLPDGSTFTGDSRYTHVFAPTERGWRLVSAQGTAIGVEDRTPDDDGTHALEPAAAGEAGGETPVSVEWYTGDRAPLRPLFEQAEDSRTQLDGYLDLGRVLVARLDDELVGHLQLVPTDADGAMELRNMAVVAPLRGRGIGRQLVATAVDAGRTTGAPRIVVATAAADVGNLRFYQRCGFRFASVERDAFTPDTGYPDPIEIDGIPLRDRVWLSMDL